MTPLERAARAAYAADWPEPLHASWEETADDMRARYTLIVRAVLTAIREPSEAMANAAMLTPGMREVDRLCGVANSMGQAVNRGAIADGSPVAQAWAAMIDAALEEG